MLKTVAFDYFADKGLRSDDAIARAIGEISYGSVWRIRTGKQQPSRRFIEGAIRVLDLPYETLFFREPEPAEAIPA